MAKKQQSTERVNGATPNGGTYSIANFMDINKNPVDKSFAVRVEITEYDSKDKVVGRTYGIID